MNTKSEEILVIVVSNDDSTDSTDFTDRLSKARRPSNRATLSSTKVDAGHSNDVHPSNDVFYLNRSTTSSTEASSSYSTSKTVTHLSIHF